MNKSDELALEDSDLATLRRRAKRERYRDAFDAAMARVILWLVKEVLKMKRQQKEEAKE